MGRRRRPGADWADGPNPIEIQHGGREVAGGTTLAHHSQGEGGGNHEDGRLLVSACAGAQRVSSRVCSAHAHVTMARAQGSSAVQQRAETGADGGGAATVARAARVDPGTPARSMTASASHSPSTAGATMRTHEEHRGMAAVALAVQRAKSAKGAPLKRKRTEVAEADEAARRALVAELIVRLSSRDVSNELKQDVNVVKYLAYLGHPAKHRKETFGPFVTPAHQTVAEALRSVVRELCLELAPGIRNVRAGTRDVRACNSTRRKVAYPFARAGDPATKKELVDVLGASPKAVIAVNTALSALSTAEPAADLAPTTVHHLIDSKGLGKVGHDSVRQQAAILARGISTAVAAGAPLLRQSWDDTNQMLTANVASTPEALMRALSEHALTSDCFGAMNGTSTLPADLRKLIASALVPSSGCRKRTKNDAATVAAVRHARFHRYTPARVCVRACARNVGSSCRCAGIEP